MEVNSQLHAAVALLQHDCGWRYMTVVSIICREISFFEIFNIDIDERYGVLQKISPTGVKKGTETAE
jgi:hypothetical protein